MEGGRCSNTFDRGILRISVQCATLIIVSHILHQAIFVRIGQPPVISQIFTGLLIGPTMLAKVKAWRDLIFGTSNTRLLGSVVVTGRMFFMLLAGLEMDIPFLLRSFRRATTVAIGSASASLIAALASSTIIYRTTGSNGSPVLFLLILALLYVNTSSPIVIRMCTELKLATSDIGRLAVSSSLLNDMTCLLILAVATTIRSGPYNERTDIQRLKGGILAIALLAISGWALRPAVGWLNRRNKGRRHIRHLELVGIVFFVISVAVLMEVIGYNSMMACFMLGLVMPREGCTVRTLVDKLSYPVNKFILPIFFGFAAISTDITTIQGRMFGAVAVMVMFDIVSKVAGTVVATRYIGIPTYEGIVLGFLLNIKGHVDLVLVSLARGAGIWGEEAQKVLLVAVVIATLTAGPAAALAIRLERRSLRYRAASLAHHSPGDELRLLACVHSPRDVPTMLNFAEICCGASPFSAYLIHLVELTAGAASYVLYNQHDAEDDGGWEHGGDDARIITAAADVFSIETGIGVQQVTVVSVMATMQEDVFNATVDVRASLVLLPFHKHQRVDGRMQVGRNGVQQLNERVLKRIPCTVGILVDRGFNGGTGSHTPMIGPTTNPVHQVAVLFFGGADDREALAFGMRLALHPCVSLTVIRFLPESRNEHNAVLEMTAINDDREVLFAISDHMREMEADEAFISTFISRSMSCGRATYVEKYVNNAVDTVTEICAMDDMYSLFLVGRGKDRISPLTRGMSPWEECPELGSVGDLLASSDFMGSSSVLVVRQYSKVHCKNEDDEDDEVVDDDFRVL